MERHRDAAAAERGKEAADPRSAVRPEDRDVRTLQSAPLRPRAERADKAPELPPGLIRHRRVAAGEEPRLRKRLGGMEHQLAQIGIVNRSRFPCSLHRRHSFSDITYRNSR